MTLTEDEAVRFVADLETGAFRRGDPDRHRIALDICRLVRDEEIAFPSYWNEDE